MLPASCMGEPAGNQAETSHVSARSLSNGTICMDYSDELTAPTTGSFLTESAVSCLANTVASKRLMFGQAIHTGTGKKKNLLQQNLTVKLQLLGTCSRLEAFIMLVIKAFDTQVHIASFTLFCSPTITPS